MKRQDSKEMRSLYEQWLLSGQNGVVFARDHGLRLSTFYYWIKKFRKESLVTSASSTAKGFSRVMVDEAIHYQSHALAIIHFPSGITVELYSGVDVSFLKELTA